MGALLLGLLGKPNLDKKGRKSYNHSYGVKEIHKGNRRNPERITDVGGNTLRCFTVYLAGELRLKPKSIKATIEPLETLGKHADLMNIKKEWIINNILLNERYSNNTKRIYLNALKKYCQWMIITGQKHSNSTENIVSPRCKKGLPRPLNPETIKIIWERLQTPRWRIIFLLLYGCGIRANELINIKVEDVDFNQNCIYITHGKGDRQRMVYFKNHIAGILKEYITLFRPRIYLITQAHTGKKMTYNALRNLFKRLNEKGLPERVTAHRLRHSFATHSYNRGMDIKALQLLLGHANIETTEIYTKVAGDRVRQEVEKVSLEKNYLTNAL